MSNKPIQLIINGVRCPTTTRDRYHSYPETQRELLTMADRVREKLGAACLVSSGLRCSRHNVSVGGVASSRHLTGKAMDFCAVGKTAAQVLAVVRDQPELGYAYAIDDSYVHMDVE